MNVKIFYGGSSGFRKILPSSTNYMPIVDLAILDDSRNRKVKVDVQGNRVEEEEEKLYKFCAAVRYRQPVSAKPAG